MSYRTDPGGFVIESETVLYETPRGKQGEVLRVTFTTAIAPGGKPVAWHALREFYTDQSGTVRPGKKGITIRTRELAGVIAALSGEIVT